MQATKLAEFEEEHMRKHRGEERIEEGGDRIQKAVQTVDYGG